MIPGRNSIEESFNPLIEEMSKRNQVEVYHLPYSDGWPLHIIKDILFVRKHSCKYAINHITGDVHYAILGLVGRASVLTIHDDYCITRAKHGIINKLYRWMFWIYLPIKLATCSICTNELNLKRVKKLYNSPDLKAICHIHPSSLFHISSHIFNKKCPRILQIGTETNKNLETTMKVLVHLKCHLVVLKPMTDLQKKYAERNGIKYTNLYNLQFKEVVEEYDKADIVVFPSLYEGFGMPIIEAQACGKPVITCNMMPMNWVAGNGAVLLNNPLDVEEYSKALEKIINDDVYRNQLIAKGIENSKRFTLETGVTQYEELYKELCIQKNLPI